MCVMEMTGLAILNAYLQSPAMMHYFNRMKEELSSYGIGLDLKTNAEILAYMSGNGSIEENIKEKYSFVLYLDKDLYVSEMLTKSGIKLFNSSESIRLCDDKMLTHIFLGNQGIRMPKTISSPLNYMGKEDFVFLSDVMNLLSFPMIAKENFGSLGKGISLINNQEELYEYERSHKSDAHLYQEYIESSKGHDYRLILINGTCVACMKRVNDNGDFRSNVAQGGHGEITNIPKSYIDLAEKAAKLLKLDVCGIDILDDEDGNPVLCEVNSNAFFQEIEKITGKNIAKLYAEHIVACMK